MQEEDQHNLTDNLTQELKRGTLVLTVLLTSDRPQYGYSLVEELANRGVAVEQNTLYPLLRRLESQGLLESTWDTSSSRPRKYYVISEAGRTTRRSLLGEWRALNKALESIAKEQDQ
ncbi:MAG: PadR family transcriptional regulator [Spirochaetales bacterium]